MALTKKQVIVGVVVLVAALALVVIGLTLTMAERNTAYAPGFSNSAFKDIDIGATGDDVERILGTPLSRHTGETRGEWSYSEAKEAGKRYKQKVIVLEQNKVVEKIDRTKKAE